MLKKLIATTALISSVAITSVAVAQTTITGSLDLTLRNTSHDKDSGALSETSMGREAQINIANKGKLNNGMDYAAGFSLEFDGSNTAVTGTAEPATISNEAVYINLISGGTTIHAGIDWIQNAKQDLIGSAGDIIDEVGASTVSGVALNYVGVLYPKESIGAGVVHNFGNGITASGLYVPNAGNVGTGNNGAATLNSTGSNSAYEIGLRGVNVNNSGISFDVWRNKAEKMEHATTTDSGETKGTAYSLGYNTGPFGLGVSKQTTKLDTALDRDTKLAQVSYAVNKNLTASLVYAETEVETADRSTMADEKVKSLMVGYNFGAVGLLVTASQIENIGALTTGKDVDALGISLNTKF
jgi:hypothetical protein